MSQPLAFALPGNDRFAAELASALTAGVGRAKIRRFPDGETYVRLESDVRARDVVLVCTLHEPDDKVLPLVMLAEAARDLGAARVGLVAPYLSYMRQDKRFRSGEGITSVYFGRFLSRVVDWLVTVDPHLHRHATLAESGYTIPASVVHAAPAVAAWIRDRVARPVLVGPDSESEQWVEAVAKLAGAPHIVLEKVRRGDREVEVSVPQVERFRDHTPVLVDDIISTARTMIETLRHLSTAGLASAVCVGIHAVFASEALEALRSAGPARIVSCDTIPHSTNEIGMAPALAEAVGGVLAEVGQAPPGSPP
jgi:ribose-phosphate pyrophosphokinase